MADLSGKTILITGASRGIGKAIALRAARDGARIAVIGKTTVPHPKLSGTVYSAVEEIEAAGGQALACPCDIRDETQLAAAVSATVDHFGGIDILVNNASALYLASTLETPAKRFDLVQQVNVRATFLASQHSIPYLRHAENPHILTIAPPLNLHPRWFAGHVAYTISKYGMSMCVLGMAEEFRAESIAVNGLWPRTAIATAAIENLLGGPQALAGCRKPEIMADAAYVVLTRRSAECTGNFFVDEDLLRDAGCDNFDNYAVQPGAPLMPDFFLGEPDPGWAL